MAIESKKENIVPTMIEINISKKNKSKKYKKKDTKTSKAEIGIEEGMQNKKNDSEVPHDYVEFGNMGLVQKKSKSKRQREKKAAIALQQIQESFNKKESIIKSSSLEDTTKDKRKKNTDTKVHAFQYPNFILLKQIFYSFLRYHNLDI